MATSVTRDPTTLTALEERVRAAWGSYRENLVDLDGVAYREAERAEWEHLQTELQEIQAARASARDADGGARAA